MTKANTCRRLVVRRAEFDDREQVVLRFVNDNGTWKVEISGNDVVFAEQIKAIIEQRHTTDASSNSDEPQWFIDVQNALLAAGHMVAEIPEHDQLVTVEFDAQTGHQLAAYELAHPWASNESATAKRIAEVAATALGSLAMDLTADVRTALEDGDQLKAGAAVRKAHDGGVFSLPLTNDLLEAIAAIDHASLEPDDRRVVLRCLVVTAEAMNRRDVGKRAAELLLKDPDARLTPASRASLELFRAIALIKAGSREAGLSVLRRISREEGLPAETRAWTWRNISLTLSHTSSETRIAAERSADAFLEAGNKAEAARSLARVVQCTNRDEPALALDTMDRILSMIQVHNIKHRALRASVFHESAQFLYSLRQHEEALKRAIQAAGLRDGLLGHEHNRISSLHLAAFSAEAIGRTVEAEELRTTARELEQRCGDIRAALADRATALISNYSPINAMELTAEALANSQDEVVAAVTLVRARVDPNLSDEEKVELLEGELSRLTEQTSSSHAFESPLLAELGSLLELMGESARATPCLRRAHELEPLDNSTFARFTQNLWKLDEWGEAVEIVERQIARVGNIPSLVYIHARSLYEVGRLHEAIPRLREAAILFDDQPVRPFIMGLIERALMVPGTEGPGPVSSKSQAAVVLTDVTAALHEFSAFVSSVKRMRFWTTNSAGKYTWRQRPEQFAQDMLHMHLQTRFSGRVHILEEIPAGAGRIDVLLRFNSGLTVMVELKMCGKPYSSMYAATGEKQLTHYMVNYHTHLGVLLVVDGRIRDFGKSVLSDTDPTRTITEIFIDVRPEVA